MRPAQKVQSNRCALGEEVVFEGKRGELLRRSERKSSVQLWMRKTHTHYEKKITLTIINTSFNMQYLKKIK